MGSTGRTVVDHRHCLVARELGFASSDLTDFHLELESLIGEALVHRGILVIISTEAGDFVQFQVLESEALYLESSLGDHRLARELGWNTELPDWAFLIGQQFEADHKYRAPLATQLLLRTLHRVHGLVDPRSLTVFASRTIDANSDCTAVPGTGTTRLVSVTP